MLEVYNDALVITGFIFVIMLVIEYVNILTCGKLQKAFSKSKLGQYVISAVFGLLPGCFGSFIVVSMYTHGIITLGALITVLVASVGDEAFAMIVLFPRDFIFISTILFIFGIILGMIIDLIFSKTKFDKVLQCEGFEFHTGKKCEVFLPGVIIPQWKKCSPHRGTLTIVLILFIIAVLFGEIMHETQSWVKISVVLLSLIASFIVSTVPDHFLEEHLWGHVVMKHIPKIFLWTLGALIFIHVMVSYFNPENIGTNSKWLLLSIAGVVGLIPSSGPHMIFVTLYSKGLIPLYILFVNSFVQDGHGAIPLLAYSRKRFLFVKILKFTIGIAVGAACIFMES
ncbi:MAG: hypothetical protein ACD_79C01162G0002 [uncultured bacterium]|nr:MAG: hypothetical protein ACD_79C01162G0002 [uncultured bacterium]